MTPPAPPTATPVRHPQRKRGRKPATYASVADLGAWMKAQPPVSQVIVIRTSDPDKAGFATMFKAGIAMYPSHPDVQALAAIGPGIVTAEGAPERARLGAYEIRRGSVPGGKGYALLGYAFVLGTSLIILYLQSARTADIPGATRDQTRNAFTEALCIMLRYFRPDTCYTPLVSRVFRNMDFAQQVLRTLRELHIDLVAEGAPIPLGTGDADLMAMLKAWFAAREADGLVSRLGNIELGMYLDQEWYLGEFILPFTWRAKSRTELNVLTGETIRIVEDRHQLEAIEAAKPILRTFLEKACQQSQTRHQLGMFLGEQGVISRASQHFGKNVRLDSAPHTHLASNGATSLLQERWLAAWETGFLRRTIALKADPRTAMPELADQVIDVDGKLFLEVETPMPAPEGGWDVEELCVKARERMRADAESPQSTAKRSKTGQQKPLNHLCDYDLDGVNHALISIESKQNYELRFRPVAEAYDQSGHKLSWLKTDRWTCSIPAAKLHASVAQAITAAIGDLEGLAAPLLLRPSVVLLPAVDPLVAALEDARQQLAGAEARLSGIKASRQRLEGLLTQRALTVNEREQLDELPADEDTARDQRRAAAQQQTRLTAQLAEDPPAAQEPIGPDLTADADFAAIDLVAAALARTTYRAPDALNQLLSRVLRNFRVQPVSHGAAVTWTATLVVPLVDGGDAEFDLASAAPVVNAKAASRREGSLDTTALTPQTLSWLFMREARELIDIGTERGIRANACPSSFLFRQTINMLVEYLAVSPGLAAAAADMPAALRPVLYRALTATGPLDDPWEARLRDVYTSEESFGPTWCMGYHREARKVIAYLEANATDPFHGLPAHQVAAGAGVPYQRLIALTTAARQTQVTRGMSYGRGRLLDKDFGVGARGNVSLLECPHKDCLARVLDGRGGVLVPIATPETTSAYGRPGEERLGVVCRSCRRMPGLRDEVLPLEYLQEWVGGRRQQVTDAIGTRWVGSRLAPLPI